MLCCKYIYFQLRIILYSILQIIITIEYHSLYAGAGIFVEGSQFINSKPVANNTALRFKTSSCYYCTKVNVYCYSSATAARVSVVLPDGSEQFTSRYSSYIIEQVSPSGLHFWNSRYYTPPQGIYTCRMPDSNGNTLEMSFGLYYSNIG